MRRDQFGRSLEGVSRRNVLTATSGITAAAFAGCLGSETSSDGESTGDRKDETEDSDALSGEVTITGSSTVYPISEEMKNRFIEKHPNVTVTVDSTGSGGGFENHFCPGGSDINAASRPIRDAEKTHCGKNDVTPVEMQIAGDALTMAVSTENT